MQRAELPESARRGIAALLVLALGACVPTPRYSRISDKIENVTFEAPPAQPMPELPPGPGEIIVEGPPDEAVISRGERPTTRRVVTAAQRTPDGVQLNFDGADVREVVRVILGDILGRTYTINPAVSGQVTLSSAGPLAESDLIAILESSLRANNATIVDLGGTYEVIPIDLAYGRPETIPAGGEAIRVRPGYGVTVVPLRHISATSAAQFVQPLIPTPEDIRIDPARNLILFAGTGPDRQNVVDMLSDLDVNWLADKSVGLFPLRVTTPEAVIPELQAIFAPVDPAGAEAPIIRFLPVARLNAVLAIGADAEQIEEVRQWVDQLDRGRSVGQQFYVYPLKNASAEELARVLNESFAEGPSAGAPTAATEAAASALGAVSPLGVDEESDLGTPLPGTPQGGVPGAPGGVVTAEGQTPYGPVKIVANRANNSLLIRGTPLAYEMIEATLRRLDTAPAQVLIEATIAEVTLNDILRYGVQYFIQTNNIAFGFTQGAARNGLFGIQPLTVTPGFNFLFTPGNSNITIDALARITNVKVLSSPSVVVQDNSEAVLTVGDEVPITTRQATGVENPDSPTVNSIEYRDTGVILQVRPRINQNAVVSLEIGQEVSRVSPTGTSDDPLTPTITQRRITSRVNVQSGQTVALGGLIQEQEQRNRDRVPVLGDLPVLGGLFGRTDNLDQRTELIVFITPRVIRSSEDARDVSEELRDRLRALRPAPSIEPVRPAPLEDIREPAPPPAFEPPVEPQRLIPDARNAPAPRVPEPLAGVPEEWLPELATAPGPWLSWTGPWPVAPITRQPVPRPLQMARRP